MSTYLRSDAVARLSRVKGSGTDHTPSWWDQTVSFEPPDVYHQTRGSGELRCIPSRPGGNQWANGWFL